MAMDQADFRLGADFVGFTNPIPLRLGTFSLTTGFFGDRS
jgi:hypothetical protein